MPPHSRSGERVERLRVLAGGDSRVGGNGSFDIATSTFTADQRGQWILEVFLFWPGSGSQHARFYLGPITVR